MSYPLARPSGSVTLIRPAGGWPSAGLRELWSRRELLYFLAWRDIKVRYKQTFVGVAWVVLQPLALMAVFSVFLGRLVGISSDGFPYPVFVYAGLLPFNYFSLAMSESANSVVNNTHLVTKVYFPRLVVPLAPILSSSLDFAISGVILLGLMLVYGVFPGPAAFALPFFILEVVVLALGVGIWLSAINVRYRDVRYALPFFLQVLFFVTPVIYSSSLLGEPWRAIYSLNPLVSVVDGFRWSLLGADAPGLSVVPAMAVAWLILVSGVFYFRRAEASFADVA
ncbi:MAG: ABC transporter permease [Chloroflexi bacterium]|nr:ABC transporter permease [Chloroflexota bacterium]